MKWREKKIIIFKFIALNIKNLCKYLFEYILTKPKIVTNFREQNNNKNRKEKVKFKKNMEMEWFVAIREIEGICWHWWRYIFLNRSLFPSFRFTKAFIIQYIILININIHTPHFSSNLKFNTKILSILNVSIYK